MSQDGLDSGSMSQADAESQLIERFITDIDLPEPASEGGMLDGLSEMALVAQVKGSILAQVAKFLGDNAGLLPDKDAVIAAVNTAVDALLAAAGRPVLTRLIGPAVKKLITQSVESLYDSILNPAPPRTEV